MLGRSKASEIIALCGRIGGVQAQLLPAAELAIWSRVEGVTKGTLTNHLEHTRSLCRTWLMRGAIHIVPSRDLHLFVGAVRNSGIERERKYLARRGVGWDLVQRITDGVFESLDGQSLTRGELADRVAKRVGSDFKPMLEHAWGDLLRPAALKGLLCFGPNRGRDPTFCRPDQWIKGWRDPDPISSEVELLRRYLGAFGPSTPKAFAVWLGASMREAQAIWNQLDDLEEVLEAGAKPVWRLKRRGSQRQPALLKTLLNLLPHFDPYTIGFPNKDSFVSATHSKSVFSKAGWIKPVVLCQGIAKGIWKHETKRQMLKLEINAFSKFTTAEQSEIKEEAELLRSFFEVKTLDLTLSSL